MFVIWTIQVTTCFSASHMAIHHKKKLFKPHHEKVFDKSPHHHNSSPFVEQVPIGMVMSDDSGKAEITHEAHRIPGRWSVNTLEKDAYDWSHTNCVGPAKPWLNKTCIINFI